MLHYYDFILALLFGSNEPRFIVFEVVHIISAFMLLKKSGIIPVWAFVPWARDYQLARCANREPEGRVYSVISFFSTAVYIAYMLTKYNVYSVTIYDMSRLMIPIMMAIIIMRIIYNIRVFSGFIEVYGVSKAWIIPCAFDITQDIPMIMWGFGKKYQPEWQVEDLAAEMKRLATQGSATVMEEGLTINLKERSVREFLHKNMLLRDIHLAIPQGHLVVLLGGSGAGKTTFLNAVNGYEKARAEVMLNGKNMYTQYKDMIYEVGVVPQTDMMRGKDTVIGTLRDAAKLRLSIDIPYEERVKRVEDVLESFGLKSVANNKVEKLSGGQRKRLSIAMEVLSNPSMFMLDEPDSGLDGVMARELFEQLRRLADSGKIVIVITHNPDRIIEFVDDIIVLAKDSTRTGRLAFYGSVEEARKFFGCEKMEEILKLINQKDEGGEGLADDYVLKYAEVANG